MILILSQYTDDSVERVIPHLERANASYHWYDPGDFPHKSTVLLRHHRDGRRTLRLETERGAIDLDAVRVVWYRRPSRPSVNLPDQDPRVAEYAAAECFELISDVWRALDAVWLPATRWHILEMQRKHIQLERAVEIGFEIPETLITNDPEAFLDFYTQHGHGAAQTIVSKPLGIALERTLGTELVRYTEPVGSADLRAYKSVATGPAIFQDYVPKDREIRVTVIGDSVFAVAIDSQRTRRTKLDWRHYDLRNTGHERHVLPPEVAARCVALLSRLQLRFGTLDLVLRPDGRYVFLEVNPTGQYLWLEDQANLPLSQTIAQELIELGKGRP